MERGVAFIFVNKKALAKRGGPSQQRPAVRGRGCVTDFSRSPTDRVARPIGLEIGLLQAKHSFPDIFNIVH